MVTSPRSSVPVTVAFNGVFSGSGSSPTMSRNSRLSRGRTFSHSALVVAPSMNFSEMRLVSAARYLRIISSPEGGSALQASGGRKPPVKAPRADRRSMSRRFMIGLLLLDAFEDNQLVLKFVVDDKGVVVQQADSSLIVPGGVWPGQHENILFDLVHVVEGEILAIPLERQFHLAIGCEFKLGADGDCFLVAVSDLPGADD